MNLEKLAEAQEAAADAATEAAMLVVEKLAEAVALVTPAEARCVRLTVRLPESTHEQLRMLAFEQRTSEQALIEAWVAEQLHPGGL